MAEQVEITGKEFRRMQLIQLDMLVELDRVCRENNINYIIFAGTLLGAVRHKGYIPWDDDADIGMLREDYEKFKKIAHKLDTSVCFFQDHSTDPDYIWGYGKLRRTGTSFIRSGQEHLKGQTGVFVDIFPFDDIPLSIPLQILQDWHVFCLRKILWSQVAKKTEHGLRRIWFSLLSHIPPEAVFRSAERYKRRSNNNTPNRVRILFMPSSGMIYNKNPINTRYGMPKKWMLEREEYDFEGKRLYGIKDADAFLSYEYGDYMKLPPEEKRTPHAPVSSYDFAGLHDEVLL